MKAHTKRLTALLLLICMLATMVPAISAAAEAQVTIEVVNYGFDVLTKYPECANLAKKSYFNKAIDGSGNSLVDAEGNDVRVNTYLTDLYATGIMNFVLESYYSQNEDEYKNFEIRADQGHRLKASNAGDWVAFRLRNPGAGIADITLTTSGTNSMNAVNIYLIKAEENLDIESNMTAANLMVSDLSVSGEYVIAEGKTLESSDYILVIEHSQINGSKYFCLTDLNIAVTKQAEPEVVAGDQTYGFDVLTQYAECANLAKKSYFNKAIDGSGNSLVDAEGNDVRVHAYLADLYAQGIMNFVLESYYSQNTNEYKNFEIRQDQGHRLKASDAGDWVAFRLKNPGAGSYNITLTSSGTATMNAVDIYLIKAEENLDIAGSMTDANLLASGVKDSGEHNLAKEIALESSDYILVVNHAEINSSAYWCLTNLELTLCQKPDDSKVMGYSLDLADPENGIYTGDDILLSDVLEDINARFSAGTLKWTLAGGSAGLMGSTAATAHLPSESVAFQKNNGLRTAGAEGQWLAFRIKSPGSGNHVISLNYAKSESTGTIAMYILPADTADIGAAMDPTNRVGKVNMNSADSDVGVVDGYSSVVGNYTFGDAQEYIVVLECYSDSVNTAGKCFMYISELVMKAGKYEDSTESTKNVQSVTVLKNAVNDGVVDPGAFAAIREVDGHDYYFLPCEGSIMLIFDLTTGEFVRQLDTGINYPRCMAVAPDGKVWLCGSNKFFFVYDPDTNTSFKTADFRVLGIPGLEAEGGITSFTIADDGVVYFGTYYGGCMVKYDPVAREFTNWGQIIPNAKQMRVEKYSDGYLYFTAQGDDFCVVGKYNLKTNEIEKTADFTELAGKNFYGVNFLGDDLIIVCGNRQNGIIALNPDTFEFVETGLPGDQGGVNLGVTEEIDGKHYLVIQGYGLYSYDVKTKTFKDEGFGTSGIGFRTGGQNGYGKSIVTLNGDPCLFTYTATGGHPRIWNLKTREYYNWDTMVVGFGAGSKLRSFLNGVKGSNEIYMGAFNTEGITVYNTELGTVTYRSKTTGQTDSLIWYEGVLYAGNYSNCVIASCDPTDPSAAKVLYEIGNSQKRVHTLAAGDGYVFGGTTPDANLFGGGIAIYNTKTGEGKFHRNVIQDQSINKLVYHDGLLYGSTSTEGGSGAGNAPGTSAVLFVYDYINGKVLASCDLREHIEGLASPIDFIAGIEADPNVAENGRFWGVVSETLFCFTYDKASNTFQVQEVLSFDKTTYNEGGSRHWFPRPIVFNKELNQIYIAFDNDGGMQCIEIADWNAAVGSVKVAKNSRIMGDTPMFYVLGEDGNLYYASGYDLMMLPLNVSDADWAVAGAVDEKIQAIGSITVESEAAVEAARAAYAELSWYYQALVQKLEVLEEAEADLLEAKIDTIANVTAESLPALREMMDEYGKMTERQQRYVKNYATLQSAYDLAMKLDAEAQAADKAAAEAAQKQIDAIGEVKLESEEAIKAARAAYDALTDAQKALVDAAKLTAAEAKLAELKTAAEKEAADKAAAEAVIKQINAIGTVTLDSKAAIEAARAAYDALTAEQKALVTNLSVLTAAEAALEAQQKAEDTKPEEPKPEDPPKTGETAPVAVWAVILVASAAALSVVLLSNIRRKLA